MSIVTSKNFTQEKLGLAIGLDEFVASTRINRYEKGNQTIFLPNTPNGVDDIRTQILSALRAEKK